jgi:phenylalanine-4-hydroxylase
MDTVVLDEHARIFTGDQHRIWQTLYKRQLEPVRKFACQEYLEGFEHLRLPQDHIPSLEELNAVITPRTGWQTVHTDVRYSDAVQWYRHFARREFLITDYIRTWDELDFTPEPDMFHDIFGHMPFMTLPRYTALQDLFAPAFNRANDEQRENIKRLAWFSTEFGLIRENGTLKIFGAGLISSSGEMEHVLSGGTPIEEFTIGNVLGHDKAIWSFNSILFVAESLEAYAHELARYLGSI